MHTCTQLKEKPRTNKGETKENKHLNLVIVRDNIISMDTARKATPKATSKGFSSNKIRPHKLFFILLCFRSKRCRSLSSVSMRCCSLRSNRDRLRPLLALARIMRSRSWSRSRRVSRRRLSSFYVIKKNLAIAHRQNKQIGITYSRQAKQQETARKVQT